ncbi:Uncharacterised protein [uncultured archaeon]|nr:Uncharacterised protein [uncultured archaeon]
MSLGASFNAMFTSFPDFIFSPDGLTVKSDIAAALMRRSYPLPSSSSTVSVISAALSTLNSHIPCISMQPLCTSVTSAPLLKASSASSTPVFPEARLVSILIGSMASAVAPPVMIMRFPASVFLHSVLSTRSTISSVEAILAAPSSITGFMNSTPSSVSFPMFSITMGWLYMDSCIAGTIIIGMPEAKAVVAKVVTLVSSMP